MARSTHYIALGDFDFKSSRPASQANQHTDVVELGASFGNVIKLKSSQVGTVPAVVTASAPSNLECLCPNDPGSLSEPFPLVLPKPIFVGQPPSPIRLTPVTAHWSPR